jgi:hypothetical protein
MRVTVCDRRQVNLIMSMIELQDRLTNEGLAARSIIRARAINAHSKAVYGTAVHPHY